MQSQSALPTRLLQANDLIHQGSFTIPDMVDATGSDRQPCNYVQGTLAYNPSRNSLFLACHDWTQTVAEISIPSLGGQATQLQAPRSVVNRELVNPTDPNDKKIGGLYVAGDKLIVSVYAFYDANGTATASHFVRSTNLTASDAVGPIRIGTLNPGFTAGYMGVVPAEWQAALGGDFVTGLNGTPINSRTSHGPALSSVSLSALLSATTSVSSTSLVAYPLSNATLGVNDPTGYWGAQSANRGVILPPGTNSALFIGQYGAGAYCYGGAECNDPTSDYKGTHAYPYYSRVWAYRLSDLADVKAGRKQPHSLYPYAMWYLPTVGFRIGGVAYDIPGNRIFISDRLGDGTKPRIHVFSIANASTGSEDKAAPTVAVSSPSSGNVNGTVTLRATASDNVGVAGVWFTVDGTPVGSEIPTSPFEQAWNSSTVANGSHAVRAVARDAAGNIATSAPVTVTVNNTAADTTAPTVSLTAPASGAAVGGTVTVSATATDNVSVASVQFTLNGVNLGAADTTAPYSISWNTTGAANGSHVLRAVARDAAGNITTSAARTVTVNNASTSSDRTAPTVGLTAPANGSTIRGTVTVSASATDNVGVVSVQFTLNGVNLGSADATAPYSISWNTTGAANGSHVLRAVARDAAGNVSTSPARTVIVNNTVSAPASAAPTTSAPKAPTIVAPSSSCSTPDPFVTMGGGTCYNGGWLPPGMTLPTTAPTSAAPTVPSTSATCTTPQPGTGWVCYNGGWLPPGMTLPTTASSTAPSITSTAATCTTPQPGSGWTCHNGGWLPPGMVPTVTATQPAALQTPSISTRPGACLTPQPGIGWVCVNGGWLPPNFPGLQ